MTLLRAALVGFPITARGPWHLQSFKQVQALSVQMSFIKSIMHLDSPIQALKPLPVQFFPL